MDEFKVREEEDAIEDHQKIDQAAFIEIKEGAHRQGGKEVLDQHDSSTSITDIQSLESSWQVIHQVLRPVVK